MFDALEYWLSKSAFFAAQWLLLCNPSTIGV